MWDGVSAHACLAVGEVRRGIFCPWHGVGSQSFGFRIILDLGLQMSGLELLGLCSLVLTARDPRSIIILILQKRSVQGPRAGDRSHLKSPLLAAGSMF